MISGVLPRFFSLTLFVLLSLTSCTSSEVITPDIPPTEQVETQIPLEESQENLLVSPIIWKDEQLFAVIQLSTDYEQTDYSKEITTACEKFFPEETLNISEYIYDGYETYFVIPRYPEEPISVYQYLFTEDYLEKGDLLQEIKGEQAFTLRCNVSDLFPNILLETKGQIITLSTSLKDGSLSESPYLQEIFLGEAPEYQD